MNTKFKAGPAKTRNGSDAYIFEAGDVIHGKIKTDEGWYAVTWNPSGFNANGNSQLLPNAEPLAVEFEDVVSAAHIKINPCMGYDGACVSGLQLNPFIGKRVKVLVTEILE